MILPKGKQSMTGSFFFFKQNFKTTELNKVPRFFQVAIRFHAS